MCFRKGAADHNAPEEYPTHEQLRFLLLATSYMRQLKPRLPTGVTSNEWQKDLFAHDQAIATELFEEIMNNFGDRFCKAFDAEETKMLTLCNKLQKLARKQDAVRQRHVTAGHTRDVNARHTRERKRRRTGKSQSVAGEQSAGDAEADVENEDADEVAQPATVRASTTSA